MWPSDRYLQLVGGWIIEGRSQTTHELNVSLKFLGNPSSIYPKLWDDKPSSSIKLSLKRSFSSIAVIKQFVLCSVFIFGPIGGNSNISNYQTAGNINDVVISCRIQVLTQLKG
jgi:hypothetical protein